MAEKKLFLDEVAGQELANQAMGYTDEKISEVNQSLQGYQPKGDYLEEDALEGYAKTSEMTSAIASAVEASEKKIFGEGKLAEAFDTIKEIGDYLENHDDVAAGLTTEIGKKVDKETYESDKATFETKQEAAATYQPKGEYALKSELPADYLTEEDLEDFVKEEDLDDLYGAIPTATVQGWFKKN